MTDEDVAARLEVLEIRAAYQDRSIEEFNGQLAAQWQEIDKLKREVVRLEAELAAATFSREPGAPEPPPPHY